MRKSNLSKLHLNNMNGLQQVVFQPAPMNIKQPNRKNAIFLDLFPETTIIMIMSCFLSYAWENQMISELSGIFFENLNGYKLYKYKIN